MRFEKIVIDADSKGEAAGVMDYKQSEKDDRAYLVDLGKFPFSTCDGLHPTTAGHRTIYETALPAFDAILKERK